MKNNSEPSMYDTVVSNTQKIFNSLFKTEAKQKEIVSGFNFTEMDLFLSKSPTIVLIYNHLIFNYDYVSPNITEVTGFEDKDFLQGGLKFAMSLVHPSHSKIYNKFVLPMMFKYYTIYAFKGRLKDLRFSYTFKIKRSNDEYMWALHHMDVIKTNKIGLPTLTMVHISDITQVKQEENVNMSVYLKEKTGTYKPLLSRVYGEDSNFSFSNREMEILELIAKGKTSKEISAYLNISVHTVISHRKNMMEKSNVKNSSSLIQMAYNKGLLRETVE